jgi:hypothetical protein
MLPDLQDSVYSKILYYIYRELQFGRSARLSNLIVLVLCLGLWFSGIVCLCQSEASVVRGGSEVDAVLLLRELLSLNFCDDPLRERGERDLFAGCFDQILKLHVQ